MIHFLEPVTTAFQAEVALGSLWKVEPERGGPMMSHLKSGRPASPSTENKSSSKYLGTCSVEMSGHMHSMQAGNGALCDDIKVTCGMYLSNKPGCIQMPNGPHTSKLGVCLKAWQSRAQLTASSMRARGEKAVEQHACFRCRSCAGLSTL